MEDLFRKVFYTGIGLVTNTTESLKKGVDELVAKGKITREEGLKVVSNLEENITEKREEFESMLNNAVGLTLNRLNLPTADSINRLEKRIKSLEIKVGLLSKELDAAEKANKKATSNGTRTRASRAKKTAAAK
ncbi:MAG: phasin family protein [Bacteroidota bacterium]